jgi:hypothetical protein
MQKKKLYVFLGLILLLWSLAEAQSTIGPKRPFEARVNLLATMNLNFSGDLTYRLPSGVGFFAGFGKKSSMVYLSSNLGWFRKSGFSTKGWGMYLGSSLPFSIAGLKRFSVRPSVSYARIVSTQILPDSLLGEFTSGILYTSSIIGSYVSLAYTHTFMSRYFVEPVIGLGLVANAKNTAPRKYGHAYFQVPAQLNVGIRF